MKAVKTCPLIALAALGVLGLPSEAQAARPRSHRCTAVIESVDVTNRTLRAASVGGHAKSLTLFWNKNPQFYIAAKPVSPADLQVGQKVSVLHRQPFIGPWRLEKLFAAP